MTFEIMMKKNSFPFEYLMYFNGWITKWLIMNPLLELLNSKRAKKLENISRKISFWDEITNLLFKNTRIFPRRLYFFINPLKMFWKKLLQLIWITPYKIIWTLRLLSVQSTWPNFQKNEICLNLINYLMSYFRWISSKQNINSFI